MQDLCSTVRATVDLSVTRQEACNRSFLDALEKFSKTQDENNRQNRAMMEMMLRLLQQQQHPTNQQSIDSVRPIDDVATVRGARALALADHLGGLPEVDEEEADTGRSFTTEQTRRAQRLGLNPVDLLLTSARKPAVHPKFPVTWIRLVREWQNNHLESFVREKTSRWDDKKLASRYTKRLRGMRVLRWYIEQVGTNIDEMEAAARLDSERNDRHLTVSSHMMQLFDADNRVNRRNRTGGNANNNNII